MTLQALNPGRSFLAGRDLPDLLLLDIMLPGEVDSSNFRPHSLRWSDQQMFRHYLWRRHRSWIRSWASIKGRRFTCQAFQRFRRLLARVGCFAAETKPEGRDIHSLSIDSVTAVKEHIADGRREEIVFCKEFELLLYLFPKQKHRTQSWETCPKYGAKFEGGSDGRRSIASIRQKIKGQSLSHRRWCLIYIIKWISNE